VIADEVLRSFIALLHCEGRHGDGRWIRVWTCGCQRCMWCTNKKLVVVLEV